MQIKRPHPWDTPPPRPALSHLGSGASGLESGSSPVERLLPPAFSRVQRSTANLRVIPKRLRSLQDPVPNCLRSHRSPWLCSCLSLARFLSSPFYTFRSPKASLLSFPLHSRHCWCVSPLLCSLCQCGAAPPNFSLFQISPGHIAIPLCQHLPMAHPPITNLCNCIIDSGMCWWDTHHPLRNCIETVHRKTFRH